MHVLLEDSTSAYLNILFHQMCQSDDLMYVYLVASDSGTLYLGVTNNLIRRFNEHRTGLNKGFSNKYSCHRLVYFEIHHSPDEAIDREKQIKRWRREKKEHLIRTLNPKWINLAPLLPAASNMVETQAVPPLVTPAAGLGRNDAWWGSSAPQPACWRGRSE
ncbi:MAG TPA: GIY-YIG nuclease family protein [Candidatus Methylomirabilis sp.]|nr:GIY-YIG nuclease family protein [Candidatus Methylomirabilis sp.]